MLLLHARAGSAAMWRRQLAAFSAAGYRCIAYDRRQSGRTEIAPGAPEALAADDLRALVDALAIERFHLLGTAAGGIVALDFALSHPERVRSLVFANSVGSAEIKQEPEYVAAAAQLRPPDELPPEIRELGAWYRSHDPAGAREWLELGKETRAKKPPFPSTRNRITLARLADLRMPTLLLTGDIDPYTPPAVLEVFHRRIPQATALVIPNSGHSAFWEQPERFNRAVLDFLNSDPGS
ncbi:MAG TPA: alpha/beta hydrolase [Burkholderiales bacterium]|nr:alpha/beta hydrolase [Burkholderiales bacterium]